jgi:DNA-binding response OmpR family regulator
MLREDVPSVLVIEDDAAVRRLLNLLLKRTNAEVVCVEDGDEGLAQLESRSYSVVILDLMLPTVNGFDVLQRVSVLMPEMLKRVIVLTAASSSTLKKLKDEERLWRVVRKPFDLDDLLHTVADCAAQRPHLAM